MSTDICFAPWALHQLWNTNHRKERVAPALDGSLSRLGLDYLDLYLIHTPFAFLPGNDEDPRDSNDNVLYDTGVTLLDTWRAMECLVDSGKCRAIGLSDISSLTELASIYDCARIKPSAIQVEAHPYLPQTELLEYCQRKGIVLLAFAPLGHGMKPGPLTDPTITSIAKRVGKTPAQVLISWAVQRGTAVLTSPNSTARARESYDIAALPQEAMDEINGIQARQRLNSVVNTGTHAHCQSELSTHVRIHPCASVRARTRTCACLCCLLQNLYLISAAKSALAFILCVHSAVRYPWLHPTFKMTNDA